MSAHVADAEVVQLAERLRVLDERKTMMAPSVRDALRCLEPLVKDSAAETFLLASRSVEAWCVLRDQDPDLFLVYLSTVRQRFGNLTARLVGDRVGMPGTGAGLRTPLPFFTTSKIWGDYQPPGYIVKRTAEPGAVTVIFGDQGTYKSAISIALATSVGLGQDFYGARTRQAAVAYLAGEGYGGMRKRLRACLLSRGMTADDEQPPIAITEAPANLMSAPDQIQATIEGAQEALGAAVGLVVVDTLAANFGPGEENSATDMSLALANARRAAPEAALIIVHHTGHSSGRERGSSSLPFGADFRFQASYDKASKAVKFENLKQKDDELQPPLYFAPRRVAVGWKDQDGEELTAVVLDRIDAPEVEEAPPPRRTGNSGLGANQEAVIKVLKRLYREYRASLEAQDRDPASASVMLGGLRQAVVDKGLMNRQRYADALDALIKRGVVEIVEGSHIKLIEAKA